MSEQNRQGSNHGGEEVEQGLEVAQQVVEGVSRAAETAQEIAEGGGGSLGDVDAAGALGTTGGVLGQAGSVAGQLGAPAEAVQALGIASQAASFAGAAVEAVEGVVHAVEALIASQDEQRHVDLEFRCPKQGDARWLVRSAEITEALNQPYLARIELAIEDLDARPRDLLGVTACLTLTRAGLARDLCGIIRRVEHGRTTDRFVTATIELVPALQSLAMRRDSRIFQNMTVPAILHDVLGNALDAYHREVDDSGLQRTYPEREYCVQYDEADLDFVHRLMEEEGIAYHFTHDANTCAEKLMLSDSNEAFRAATTFNDQATIPFVPQRNEIHGAEPVHALLGGTQLTTTSVVAADFDWTRPDVADFAVTAELRGEDDHSLDREVYDHTTGFTLSAYSGSAYGKEDSVAQTKLRSELATRDAVIARGNGVVTAFTAGKVFTLERHPQAELDGDYLITKVRHRAVSATLRDLLGGADGEADAELDYENWFECMPRSVPYRPSRKTPRPRAHGVLTAIVVGPNGAPIHSDDYGRVKVQFPWDRFGTRDDNSSCYLRVMQAWAGANRGIQTFPRVGDEVVVDFIGGNIDRPLVVGSLYSAANPPPYRTEQDWTRTTIKTQTSPADGDKHNELRFDDKQGHEEILMHASRDLRETVTHCHSTSVGVDQSNSVGRDQTETIDRDQTLAVKGKRTVTVDKNEEITIGKDQAVDVIGNQTTTIQQNESLNTGGLRDVYIAKKDTETFNGGRDVTVHEFDNLHVQANHNLTVKHQHNVNAGEHIAMAVATNGSKFYMKNEAWLEAQKRVAFTCGSSRIVMKPSELEIACGAASIVLKADGTLEMRGSTKASLGSAGSTLELTPTAASLSSAQINSTAIGIHEVKGALVKIN